MKTILLDDQSRFQIDNIDDSAEIRKPDGRVVGRYLPEAEYRKLMYALAEATCPFSEEELERRRHTTGGSSLAEFWKRMGVK